MMQQHSKSGRGRGLLVGISLGLAVMLCGPIVLSAAETVVPAAESGNGEMPHSGLEHNSNLPEPLYVCPMHPQEVSNKPGSCSQCGMFLLAREESMDHSMHQHAVPAADNGKHAQTPSDDAMQHGKMPMPGKARPLPFWEGGESQAGGITEHAHAEPGQGARPISKRMTPELPMNPATPEQFMLKSTEEHAGMQREATYICPMHPQIVSREAGSSCPICGMDLVAKESAATAGDHPQVFLSAMVIQNMGVRTAKVQRKGVGKQIRTQGIVTPDDDHIIFIHPRTGGWIETLYPITEGERVERKDVLANFYSPWINRVQLNYIAALEEYDLTSFDPAKKTEVSAKVESLRNSLRLLNVMDMDIMRIKNSRRVQNTIQLMAPQGGIITNLGVREGSYVEPYQSMFTIIDLSGVWVMMDIFEYQAPWIRKGHKVKITAPAIPGRHWNGVVDFIYPEVDPKSRTLRARIEVPNPDEALLLNMFVQIDLSASASKHDVLSVPREAVIVTGEREVVVKSLGKGHFQPVDISTGAWDSHRAEILSGLNEGDDVVVSGQFLIDSESSLQASFLRMTE